MSRHPTEKALDSIWLAPAIPKTEPDALLHVKLIAPEKEPAALNPRLRWLIVVAIASGVLLLILWGTYVHRRTYPPPVDVSPLSVALVPPAYVAIGDEAYLDVTVTNSGTVPVSGTVAIVFEGSAGARPSPSQETVISLDDLAGGASLTQRIRFFISRAPTLCCQDTVRLSLQAAVGGQHIHVPVGSQIAVAPVPYIKTFISLLSSSGIIAAVVTFLWDEIKKHLFGLEGK